MLNSTIIIISVFAILAVLLWISADKIYQSHYSTKRNHPFLFKITGFNERHLDDREKWIKHFRIQLLLISILFICALWILTRGL